LSTSVILMRLAMRVEAESARALPSVVSIGTAAAGRARATGSSVELPSDRLTRACLQTGEPPSPPGQPALWHA
jgi:hypothetical protein